MNSNLTFIVNGASNFMPNENPKINARAIPSPIIEMLSKIAKALNVGVDDLMK